MTEKKLARRGRNAVLPIVGDTLAELHLGTCILPTLMFKAADGCESQLQIEDIVKLSHGDQEIILEGSKPGVTFNPKELSPLLELLGCRVVDAVAEAEGLLRVIFSGNYALEVAPSTPYEAWHFQYPRPGRPASGKSDQFVGVTGTNGRLI